MVPFPIAEPPLLASTAYIMSAAAFPYASIFTARFHFVRTAILYLL
jgi:hypothetical protein